MKFDALIDETDQMQAFNKCEYVKMNCVCRDVDFKIENAAG